jgi:hypothetical protein
MDAAVFEGSDFFATQHQIVQALDHSFQVHFYEFFKAVLLGVDLILVPSANTSNDCLASFNQSSGCD